MFTESGTFVVVDFKPVGHVDLEALLVDLQRTHTSHHTAYHGDPSTGLALQTGLPDIGTVGEALLYPNSGWQLAPFF